VTGSFIPELLAKNSNNIHPYTIFTPASEHTAMIKIMFQSFLLMSVTAAALAQSVSINPGALLQDCADCPEMVVIPSGAFTMGENDGDPERTEGPERMVTIPKAFALGRYEITVGQFADFIAATGQEPEVDECSMWVMTEMSTPNRTWRDPGYKRSVRNDEAVVCVSWRDARAYAAWLSGVTGQRYRLPTEAEWEYAAKGGTESLYYWGNDPDDACRYANVYDTTAAAKWPTEDWDAPACDDGFADTSPVGSFEPNPFGLYDILGNVWEWNQDCAILPYPDSPTDGSAVEVEGACDLRSIRGGGWITQAYRQRPTWRGTDPERQMDAFFGFRIARDLN
jgi:formylglycine-generating enzyme required for sulfatase activity